MSAPGKLSKLTKLSKLSTLVAPLVSPGGHLAPHLGPSVSVQNDAFTNFWRSDPGNLRQVFQVTVSQNRFSCFFGFFGEQSSVLKLLKFIPVRYLKFSTCRTGSAMPGGLVLHRLQYCSVTAVVQAVVQLYSLCMDRTVPVLMYLKFSRYRTLY